MIFVKVIETPNAVGSSEYFGLVLLGECFMFNGSEYIKTSTRTARLCGIGKVRYFSSADKCIITRQAKASD